jgi:hypothetical protein
MGNISIPKEPTNLMSFVPSEDEVARLLRVLFGSKRLDQRRLFEFIANTKRKTKSPATKETLIEFYKDNDRLACREALDHPNVWDEGVAYGEVHPDEGAIPARNPKYSDPMQKAFRAGVTAGRTALAHAYENERKRFNRLRDRWEEKRAEIESLSGDHKPSFTIDFEGYDIVFKSLSEGSSSRKVGQVDWPSDDVKVKTWSETKLRSLLRALEKGQPREDDEADVRISTSAFPPNECPEEELVNLTKKGFRVEVIMTNPERWDLVKSRNEARTDEESLEEALDSIRVQSGRLLRHLSPSEIPGSKSKLKYSNLMPVGFYVLTRDKALYGGLWSHTSFSKGPIIEAQKGNPLYAALEADWRARWKYPDDKEELAFRQFFGIGAWSQDPSTPRGVIVLQSDFIGRLASPWGRSLRQHSSREALSADNYEDLAHGRLIGTDRGFKARRWINTLDTDGCQFIMDLFNRFRINTPRIVFSEHAFHDAINIGSPPFEITMGGFASKARAFLNRIGKGWMRFHAYPDTGDTLLLRRDLIKTRSLTTIREGEYCRILPGDWNANYIARWEKKILAPNDYQVSDYAWILRWTIPASKPPHVDRICLFLSGFTESGTAAAGWFVANKWKELLERFQLTEGIEKRCGDFLILIKGESDAHGIEDGSWRIVEEVKLPLKTVPTSKPKSPSLGKKGPGRQSDAENRKRGRK